MDICDLVFLWQCTCHYYEEDECPPTLGTATTMFEEFDENENCILSVEEMDNLLNYRYEDV